MGQTQRILLLNVPVAKCTWWDATMLALLWLYIQLCSKPTFQQTRKLRVLGITTCCYTKARGLRSRLWVPGSDHYCCSSRHRNEYPPPAEDAARPPCRKGRRQSAPTLPVFFCCRPSMSERVAFCLCRYLGNEEDTHL